jgi:glyoxylase-like metal-dependent hydrolase (beta-lactamase superfamily II)
LLAERGFSLALILLTHTHGGVADDFLAHYPGAGIVVGPQGLRASVGQQVRHGEVLGFGNEVIQVIATPGHTADSLSYLWRDRLFCGDALALGGCPLQTDDDDCDPRSIYDSVVDRLFALPAEDPGLPRPRRPGRTVSTIGEERSRNPSSWPARGTPSSRPFAARAALPAWRPPGNSPAPGNSATLAVAPARHQDKALIRRYSVRSESPSSAARALREPR